MLSSWPPFIQVNLLPNYSMLLAAMEGRGSSARMGWPLASQSLPLWEDFQVLMLVGIPVRMLNVHLMTRSRPPFS
jgi:hypothetical protein